MRLRFSYVSIGVWSAQTVMYAVLQGVSQSRNVLMFLSDDLMGRPFCQVTGISPRIST
jgi:hypothetical protein